jgi:hypothetical protein
MAGYCGAPLPKKLGIKDEFRVVMHNLPKDIGAELKEPLSACTLASAISALQWIGLLLMFLAMAGWHLFPATAVLPCLVVSSSL